MDAMQRFEDAFGPPDDDDNEVSGALSADKTQGAGSAKRDGGGSNLVGSRSKGSKEKPSRGKDGNLVDVPVAVPGPHTQLPPRQMDAPQIGQRIEVYWPDDKQWYAAHVRYFDIKVLKHSLRYEIDNQDETIDLLNEDWRAAPLPGDEIRVFWEDDDAWYRAIVQRASHDELDGALVHHELRYVDDGIVESCDMRYELWEPIWARPDRPKPKNKAAHQEPTEEPITALVAHIVSLGGYPSMLDGWKSFRFLRGVAGGEVKRGADSYLVFEAPNGRKFYSKVQVAKALGLEGRPSKPAAHRGLIASLDDEAKKNVNPMVPVERDHETAVAMGVRPADMPDPRLSGSSNMSTAAQIAEADKRAAEAEAREKEAKAKAKAAKEKEQAAKGNKGKGKKRAAPEPEPEVEDEEEEGEDDNRKTPEVLKCTDKGGGEYGCISAGRSQGAAPD